MAINQSRPEYMDLIRVQFPGGTDEQKAAANVIEYTRTRITDPDLEARVVARLEAELAQMSGSPAVE
jgi:hypothetical protein